MAMVIEAMFGGNQELMIVRAGEARVTRETEAAEKKTKLCATRSCGRMDLIVKEEKNTLDERRR